MPRKEPLYFGTDPGFFNLKGCSPLAEDYTLSASCLNISSLLQLT